MDKSTHSVNNIEDRSLQVRIAMLRSRVSQVEVAKKLGVTKQAVNNVVSFQSISERIRQEICSATGASYTELWEEKERKDYNEGRT